MSITLDTAIEIFAVLTGLLYVYLEIKQLWSLWVVGIVSSLVFVYVFFVAKLYADALLNVYYALASVYGMWCWRKKSPDADTPGDGTARDTLHISRLTLRGALILTAISLALWGAMRFVLARYTDSPVPTGDAFVTALSITGTYMLAKKILEQWHVWIVINLVSIGLYLYKDLYPTTMLYVVYYVLSFYGLKRWQKSMCETQTANNNP